MVFTFKALLFLVWFAVAGSALHAQNFYGEYYMDRHGGDRSYYAYLTPDTFLFEAKDYWKESTKSRTFVFYPEDEPKQVVLNGVTYALATASKDTDNFILAVNDSTTTDTLRLYQISKYTLTGIGLWYDNVLLTTRATGRPARFRQFVMDTLADREWVLSATTYQYDEKKHRLYRDGPQQLYFSQQEQQQITDAYAERGKYLTYALAVKEERRWKKGKLVNVKTYPLDSFFDQRRSDRWSRRFRD